jgi:hypothetical protein
VKGEYVRCLQYRIGEQAVIGLQTLRDLVFVAGAPLQQAHWRHARKYPGQFGYLRDIRLPPEYGFLRIKAQCQVVHGHLEYILRQLSRLRPAGQGVIVCYKIIGFILSLKLKMLTHSAEIIADMQLARRLYPRKYSHLLFLKVSTTNEPTYAKATAGKHEFTQNVIPETYLCHSRESGNPVIYISLRPLRPLRLIIIFLRREDI